MRRHRTPATIAISILAIAMGAGTVARAAPPTATSAYDVECGSCHLAYPARMLSTFEWGQVLGQLERHYGVDASLDPEAVKTIARHVRAEPSSAARGATGLPRITTQQWFQREHDEVGARIFQSPAVKSPSNCPACHLAADRGDFNENSVRIPR